MRKITHLILHCSGSDRSTVESMRWYHKVVKLWADIAYHKIGYADGSVHLGRREARQGAGVTGMNKTTLHYCMVGDLNKHPPTAKQWITAANQFVMWCRAHDLDPMVAILGHRETGPFVPKAMRTKKPCPGTKVDMNAFRAEVQRRLNVAA